MFAYELCSVTHFGVHETSQAENVIVDGHKLFYDVELPHDGTPSDLIASMQDHTVSLGENVTMDTPDDGVFSHESTGRLKAGTRFAI